MDQVKISPSLAIDKSGLFSVLRHTFLPLLAQGLIEALQSFNLTTLSPGMYLVTSAVTQGVIQFLNKFLREHKHV